jgi:S1-C subfamily serine protease
VNNTKLDTGQTLSDVVNSYVPGDELKLSVWRNDKDTSLTLKLGSQK